MNRLFLLLVIVQLTSCENYIGGDFNADPNHPITVPVTSQFPAFQIALADTYAGEYSRLTSALTQQVEGVARPYNLFYNYSGITPDGMISVWNNIYEKVLIEIKIAEAEAKAQGLNHHLGVLNIMEAFTLMMATDVWDNIPYSTALQGFDNPEPTFDEQALIYEAIFTLLEDGIGLLNGPSGPVAIGSEDVYLAGDIDRWMKAAYAIKARGFLHFDDYEEALIAAKQSFTSPEEGLGYQYPGPEAAFNWYRFNRDRTGDIEFGPFLRDLLISKQDSYRLPVLDQPFWTNHPYMTADHFFELISYREVQFIIAEIEVRNNEGGSTEGYEALLNGIRASFQNMGLPEAAFQDYINSPQFPQAGNLTVKEVILEKYIALFLQPEVYSDFRRTGFPELIPASGPAVPVRWPYSADEHQFNPNAPAASQVNIFTDRVGWNR